MNKEHDKTVIQRNNEGLLQGSQSTRVLTLVYTDGYPLYIDGFKDRKKRDLKIHEEQIRATRNEHIIQSIKARGNRY